MKRTCDEPGSSLRVSRWQMEMHSKVKYEKKLKVFPLLVSVCTLIRHVDIYSRTH